MNGRMALLAVVLGGAFGGRRLALAAAPESAVPPACAQRVQRVDAETALLGCDLRARDGDRLGPGGERLGRMAGPALRLLGLPVDVNRSSVEDLQALPGVGPKLAQRIAAARPYACAADLQRVPGIGPKRWTDLKHAVTVDDANGRRVCADHL